MGKPTGFMEYNRKDRLDRAPLERIHDWEEFHIPISEEEQKSQAARCMECAIPYCHVCTVVDGLASGCPVTNLIPDWNDLIYRGLWKQAYILLTNTNNFPEFTARVCPAPCEGSCTAGLHGDPVTIKENEYAIIEKAFKNGWVSTKAPDLRTGKRVAVIGSGPAGLACADQLNIAGHLVTVYERDDRFGGLLMYGIPNMKLDKKIVQRRIDILRQRGIKFVGSYEIGKDISISELQENFDAIAICCGATKPRDLNVEGRELNGVYFAVNYLTQNAKSLLNSNFSDKNFIDAKDKKVIVIGGGDTGTDCVGSAIRQKCKSVIQLEIMPRPSDSRPSGNPWPQFPNTYKIDYGQEEAMALTGNDPRIYNTLTKKLIGDNEGNLKEVHTVLVEWKKNDDGKYQAIEIKGSEKVYKADLIFLAMGFLGPEDTIPDEINLERDERSNVKADYGDFHTSNDGIFAAGDMRRGQSLVVWAINEGRGAAREIDKYLMGESKLP
jgi:glutamate synthase (NADPH/NADH) small chain